MPIFAFRVVYKKRAKALQGRFMEMYHTEVRGVNEKEARISLVEEYNKGGYKVIRIDRREVQ